MNQAKALEFCKQWLSAWTGNQPHLLIEYYAENAFYSDPGNPEGIRGKANLLPYFQKLLAKYPDWLWSAVEVFPFEQGFILKWNADIKGKNFTGMDIVELIENKIIRNEVYFDPRQLAN